MPPALVGIFQGMGLEAVHHNSIFMPTTSDPEIIKYISDNDLILVTYDRRMIHAHKTAFAEYSPSVIFLSANIASQRIADQKEWYATVWKEKCKDFSLFTPKTQVSMDIRGNVRVIWKADDAE